MRQSIAKCTNALARAGIVTGIAILSYAAHAEPGDAQAVAQARKDYAQAMRGHDKGVQNAMRAQLAAQLVMSRERLAAKKKRAPAASPRGAAQPRDAPSADAKSSAS